MKNLLEKLDKSNLNNLKYVFRYSGFKLIHPESVSDHVWGMLSLALDLIPEFNKEYGANIDLNKVIYKIVIHDLDECITCDIPKPFKYRSNKLRETIEEVTNEMLAEEFDANLYSDIINAKSDDLEGNIVKILDTLQAGEYMRTEINLGNSYMKTEVPNVIEGLNKIMLTRFNDNSILSNGINSFLTSYIVINLSSLCLPKES